MIDYIEIETDAVPDTLLDNGADLPFVWRGIQFVPIYMETNDMPLRGFKGRLKGLRLEASNGKLTVSNSLHKFYKGENYSDFTFTELSFAIDELCRQLGIEPHKWRVKKLEFGVNVSLKEPFAQYLRQFNNYKGKRFAPMLDKSRPYGVKCFLEEYRVKVYDKTEELRRHYQIPIDENIMRFELEFIKVRPIAFIGTLDALLNKETIRQLADKLLKAFEDIFITESADFSKMSGRDVELYFAGQSLDYWTTVKAMSKETAKKRKQRFKLVCNEIKTGDVKQEIFDALRAKIEYLLDA